MAAADPQFLFEDSSYTETSNAADLRFVLRRKVPLWGIPAEMKRVTFNMHKIGEVEKDKPFQTLVEKLCGAQLGVSAEVVTLVVNTYTPYAFKQFFNHSKMKASNFIVTAVEIVSA